MRLRTAVVGAGVVSDRHLSGLEKCPHTKLVAICDVEEERAREAAEEYGIDYETDVDALVAKHDLDWAHICTPVQTHLPIAREFIEAGVDLHIEKPITETVEEVEELERLKERHGVTVTATHQHRFDPAIRKAHDLIEAGELGQLRGFDLQYTGETTPDYVQRGDWAMELEGGEFEEGLPHPLYVMLGFAGYPESEDDVQTTTTLYGDYERDFSYDSAQVTWPNEEEAIASVKLLAGSTPQRRVHIYGEDLALTVDIISQTVIRIKHNFNGSSVDKARNAVMRSADQVVGTAKNAAKVAKKQIDDSWELERNLGSHYYQFDAEARALLYDEPMPVPFEEAKWTITLLEHIRESARERPKIAVESDD